MNEQCLLKGKKKPFLMTRVKMMSTDLPSCILRWSLERQRDQFSSSVALGLKQCLLDGHRRDHGQVLATNTSVPLREISAGMALPSQDPLTLTIHFFLFFSFSHYLEIFCYLGWGDSSYLSRFYHLAALAFETKTCSLYFCFIIFFLHAI